MPIWTAWLGMSLYLVNLLFGLGLQLRLYRLRRAKWVHHALYFFVFVAAIASAVSSPRWWALVPTLLCLAALPRFKGGSRIHAALTLIGFCGYLGLLI